MTENRTGKSLDEILARSPIVAATDGTGWQKAISSEAEVLFHLRAHIQTAERDIQRAKERGKRVLIHLDPAEGIGRDNAGIEWLARLGADGIISTRTQLICRARETGLWAVQRFFALDSKGVHSLAEAVKNADTDWIEILPGVIPKVLRRFATQGIPVIASGLIETKEEITAALSAGARAVSTGNRCLWSGV